MAILFTEIGTSLSREDLGDHLTVGLTGHEDAYVSQMVERTSLEFTVEVRIICFCDMTRMDEITKRETKAKAVSSPMFM